MHANAIVATGESSTVRLDAKTFKKLDLAQQTADWSSHSGTAFIDSEDNPQSIVLLLIALKTSGMRVWYLPLDWLMRSKAIQTNL